MMNHHVYKYPFYYYYLMQVYEQETLNDWQNDALARRGLLKGNEILRPTRLQKDEKTIRPSGDCRDPDYVCDTRAAKRPPITNYQR